MTFGVIGAYLNGFVGPYYVFGIQALSGVFLFIVSLFMDRNLEIEGDFEAEETVNADPTRSGIHLRRSFCQEISHNFHVCKNALKVREL